MEPLITLVMMHGKLGFSAFSFNNYAIALTIMDTSLAMVLAIFIAFYITKRRRLAQSQTESASPFLDILERVKGAISEGILKEAVLAEFPKILNAAAKIDGASVEASSTAYEVINRELKRISNEAREALMSLYQLYERVKFGNESPSSEEGLKFIEALERLQGITVGSETMVA